MTNHRSQRWGSILPVAILLLGFLNVFFNLQGFAWGWDPAEYVWVIRAQMLPHSPYLGFLVAGHVASILAPTALALSLLSAVSCLAAAFMLVRLARNLGFDEAASLLTGFFFVALPVVMTYACIQEVYGFQTFWIVASGVVLTGGSSWRHSLGGLLFGMAVASHSGSIFCLPAMLFLVWRGGESGRDLVRDFASFAAPGILIGVLSFGWLTWLFREFDAPPAEALSYLRGIAESPDLAKTSGLASGLWASAARFFGNSSAGWPYLMLGCVLGGVARAASQYRPILVFALLFASPYWLYEGLLGSNPDLGVYVVFFAPPASLLAGLGASAVWRQLQALRQADSEGGRAAATAGLAVVVVVLLTFYGSSIADVRALMPQDRVAQMRTNSTIRASEWIEANLSSNAIVVQPRSIPNVNLLPSIHLRRPVIIQGGRYLLLGRYERWTPMKSSSYLPLSAALLEKLLNSPHPVVAYNQELAAGYPGLALDFVPIRGQPLYRVVRKPEG